MGPRRSARQRRSAASLSAEHLVGYVHEWESPEMIMKKFERLEALQQELSGNKENTAENASPTTEPDSSSRADASDGASSERSQGEDFWQLVYKATSNVTTESIEEAERVHFDELLRGCESFWSEEDLSRGKRRRLASSAPKEKAERPRMITEVRDVKRRDVRTGLMFIIKKKVRKVDPSAVIYTRIPADPLPASWAMSVRGRLTGDDAECGMSVRVDNVLKTSLAELGEFRAALVDPPWREKPSHRGVTMKDMEGLQLDRVLPFGFIFIWIAKDQLSAIVRLMKSWGFNYVENMCWIQKRVNNRLHKTASPYFAQTKVSLFIFRKEGDVELRHQRSPDVVYDFAGVRKGDRCNGLRKPDAVYDMIETLLPTCGFDDANGRGMFLELWARPGHVRKGWTSVWERA